MKGINVLGLGATFAAVAGAITLSSSSAQAFTFKPGDLLSGTATFQLEKVGQPGQKNGNGSFFNFADLSKPVAQHYSTNTGTFEVESESKGNFTDYINNGLPANSAYTIKDFDFSSVPFSITNFLSYNDGNGGKDEWSMDWKNIEIIQDSKTRGSRVISLIGDAGFKSGNQVSGIGSLATTIRINQATGNATFEYEVQAVPEPASVLGLLAVGALGAGSLKRKKSS
ncbi:MAG: PEP-CTERM sorting domain-containing protein [Hydrococcus sp. Prado102]|nr:PEP-CTERM sorting domain-containing protein [Hydrococcus sp. Prado102]